MIRTDCNVSRRISWQNAGAKNATASSGYVTLAATILDNSPGWITAARISLTERTLAGDRLRLLDFKVGDEPCVMTTERFVRRQYLMFIAKYAKSSLILRSAAWATAEMHNAVPSRHQDCGANCGG